MKMVIFGSRDFKDYDLLCASVASTNAGKEGKITHVISGDAAGADRLGARYAREHEIEVVTMPADWKTYGRSAGYKRNFRMAGCADVGLGFWDGTSPGTRHMIDIMNEHKKPMLVINFLTGERFAYQEGELMK